MNLSILPNLICVLRILLVAPILWTLAEGRYGWTLVLFIVAALSDGLDGLLAKRFGWTSELGKFLDPLADKLLLVPVTVVLRDLVIGAGAAIFRLRYGPLNGRPTAISKLNTVCQIAYVVVVVAGQAMGGVPDWLVSAATGVVFISTVASGYDYVMTYARRAAAVARGRGAASEGSAE
ncbi:MAG: CDP-alcohol phosphatidyltransferase family protein [Steroidobacteraceae bacterium]